MTSSQRNDEARSYWIHGYNTNSKSSLLFKAKRYDEEDRCKLSSSSEILLGKEGPGSTVKIRTIMIYPIRLGMTRRITKLVSNENYLELSNRSAESIHLPVLSSDQPLRTRGYWNW